MMDFYRRVLIVVTISLIIALIVDVFVKYYINVKKKSRNFNIPKFVKKFDEFLIGLIASLFIVLIISLIMLPITSLMQYLVNLW